MTSSNTGCTQAFDPERSYRKITVRDLSHLRDLALGEIKSFFALRRDLEGRYRHHLISIALCQGAALHFVDGHNGVKDFDIYFFFGCGSNPRLYNRKTISRECGLRKFGVHPKDGDSGYKTRRVDYLRRCVGTGSGRSAQKAIQDYLAAGNTKTARCLSEKAVVGLWPKSLFACVIWPLTRQYAPPHGLPHYGPGRARTQHRP